MKKLILLFIAFVFLMHSVSGQENNTDAKKSSPFQLVAGIGTGINFFQFNDYPKSLPGPYYGIFGGYRIQGRKINVDMKVSVSQASGMNILQSGGYTYKLHNRIPYMGFHLGMMWNEKKWMIGPELGFYYNFVRGQRYTYDIFESNGNRIYHETAGYYRSPLRPSVFFGITARYRWRANWNILLETRYRIHAQRSISPSSQIIGVGIEYHTN